VLAEIDPRRILSEQSFELFVLENIDPHRREKRASLCFVRVEPSCVVSTCIESRSSPFGFS
jgi:hypothetical protein